MSEFSSGNSLIQSQTNTVVYQIDKNELCGFEPTTSTSFFGRLLLIIYLIGRVAKVDSASTTSIMYNTHAMLRYLTIGEKA
jgi:poly(3-hydroxyalkanoate) synthetase